MGLLRPKDGSALDFPASPHLGRGRQGLRVLRPTLLPRTLRKPDKLELLVWASGFWQVRKAWSHWPCGVRPRLSGPPAPSRLRPEPRHPSTHTCRRSPGRATSPSGSLVRFSLPPSPGEATSKLGASSPHFAKPKPALSPRVVPSHQGDPSRPQRGIGHRGGSTKQVLCPKQGPCAWHEAEPSIWALLGECPMGAG